MTVKYELDVETFRQVLAFHAGDLEKGILALTGVEEIMSAADARIESGSLQCVLVAIIEPMAEKVSALKLLLEETRIVTPGCGDKITASATSLEGCQ